MAVDDSPLNRAHGNAVNSPIHGRLIAASALTAETNLLRFRMTADLTGFEAGQYIEMLDDDGARIPFSIASTKADLPNLELHYSPIAGHPDVPRMARVLASPTVNFAAPSGNCWLNAAQRQQPLLLAAAGTGIAQSLSILRSLRQQSNSPSVELYWGVRHAAQLYLGREFDAWARDHNGFSWQAIVSDEPDYHGRRGLLPTALTQDAAGIAHRVAVLSGGPAAVYAMYDALLAAGARAENILADVFAYAPRPP